MLNRDAIMDLGCSQGRKANQIIRIALTTWYMRYCVICPCRAARRLLSRWSGTRRSPWRRRQPSWPSRETGKEGCRTIRQSGWLSREAGKMPQTAFKQVRRVWCPAQPSCRERGGAARALASPDGIHDAWEMIITEAYNLIVLIHLEI